MVRLRFKRFGRTHAPVYRLCAMDKRSPRDGQAIEELGQYDPRNADAEKQFNCNEERVRHWLSTGAQPSETVRDLLIKAGIVDKATGKQTTPSA
ncbi:MAG: 30S ribosomal protein S16 [Planctomycetota bacterium]